MKKHHQMWLAALAGAALLTACGQTGFDNSELIVGVECAYPPFNWSEASPNDFTLPIANQSGLYADGFDIQVAKKLGEDLGKNVKIMQVAWTSLIADLSTGAINCIISGMTDTPEREQIIDFSSEYYRSELVLVVKKDVADGYSAPLSSDELRSLIQGQIIESQVDTATNDIIGSVFAPDYGAIQATPVTSFPLAATDVSSGIAFAMTAEFPVAESIVASMNDLGIIHLDQSILGEYGSELGVSVGIQKGNAELKSLIDAALAGWDGEWKVTAMESALSRSSYLG